MELDANIERARQDLMFSFSWCKKYICMQRYKGI
jgi:hypothetical protein